MWVLDTDDCGCHLDPPTHSSVTTKVMSTDDGSIPVANRKSTIFGVIIALQVGRKCIAEQHSYSHPADPRDVSCIPETIHPTEAGQKSRMGRCSDMYGIGASLLSALLMNTLINNSKASVTLGTIFSCLSKYKSHCVRKTILLIAVTGVRWGLGQHMTSLSPGDFEMYLKVSSYFPTTVRIVMLLTNTAILRGEWKLHILHDLHQAVATPAVPTGL